MKWDKAPHRVDIIVGVHVRERRKMMNLSQTDLANAVGVTFQQIQKYESGVNRISSSKLFEISKVLQTPIQYFFTLPEPQTEDGLVSSSEEKAINFLFTPEGRGLAQAFSAIQDSRKRQGVLRFIRGLTDDT